MDRGQGIPQYLKVAETIKGRIRQGRYAPGESIPTSAELEAEFGVSNITIRKSLALLVEDGLASRRRGVGTKVIGTGTAKTAIPINGGDFRTLFNSHVHPEGSTSVDVLRIGPGDCPARIRRILGLDKDVPAWRMERIRRSNGQPLAYLVNFGRMDECGPIHRHEVEKRSFVEVFQEVSGIELSKVEQRVDVAVADLDLAGPLEVEFGAPIFFVEFVYYSKQGNPVEVTQMHGRGDRFAYTATIRI